MLNEEQIKRLVFKETAARPEALAEFLSALAMAAYKHGSASKSEREYTTWTRIGRAIEHAYSVFDSAFHF